MGFTARPLSIGHSETGQGLSPAVYSLDSEPKENGNSERQQTLATCVIAIHRLYVSGGCHGRSSSARAPMSSLLCPAVRNISTGHQNSPQPRTVSRPDRPGCARSGDQVPLPLPPFEAERSILRLVSKIICVTASLPWTASWGNTTATMPFSCLRFQRL